MTSHPGKFLLSENLHHHQNIKAIGTSTPTHGINISIYRKPKYHSYPSNICIYNIKFTNGIHAIHAYGFFSFFAIVYSTIEIYTYAIIVVITATLPTNHPNKPKCIKSKIVPFINLFKFQLLKMCRCNFKVCISCFNEIFIMQSKIT